MIVESQAVGPFFKNGFVVGCEETREAVLIDPGDEVASLLAFAERGGLTIRHILLTHAHVDHVTGVAAAKRALRRAGLPASRRSVSLRARGRDGRDVRPDGRAAAADRRVLHAGAGDRVRQLRGARRITRRAIVPGGVCLQIGKKGTAGKELFVGDTLFAGSIGRTDLPGGDYDTLIASIRNVLFPFGDDADRASGTRTGHDDRRGTPHESVPQDLRAEGSAESSASSLLVRQSARPVRPAADRRSRASPSRRACR